MIAGQGTLALEALDDAPDTDLVVASIGGGGLIAGVATAVKGRRPEARMIGVEATGAPKIHQSLRAGRVSSSPASRPPPTPWRPAAATR